MQHTVRKAEMDRRWRGEDKPRPDAFQKERAAQVPLLRDIFGPFHPPAFVPPPPAWIGRTNVQLAEAAYADRSLPSGHLDTVRLAILSDALEEAGCTDVALLSHLRSPGPHVRGCWAVDLVLARS